MPSREDGREGLTELPIEAGIMRNDQIGRFNDGVQLMEVDHLARHHFVCDAGQARDLGRIWSARLLQATINADDIANVPAASNVNATAPISMISSLRWLRPVVSVSRITLLRGNPGRTTGATVRGSSFLRVR